MIMRTKILALSLFSIVALVSCKENASDRVKAQNVEQAAARDAVAEAYPEISFDQTEYDFGQIDYGTNVEHKFTFTNTGEAPLVITGATSTCGCTVPTFTEEPIAPGEKGEMVVKFDGTGFNQVTKTVTVRANTRSGTEQVRIKAFVNPRQ